MAPVIVDPASRHAFADAGALARWFKANHHRAPELWLQLAKAGSGIASVSYAEALDEALCWGWIDGQKKSLDARYWLQRFTPRGKASIWSRTNRDHVERLRAAGRMQAPGEAEVARAQADGRWARAYGGFKDDDFPADLRAAISAEPRAEALFATLSAQNRFALAFRTHNMKTAEGRARKIAELVARLGRGETPHPNGKGK